MATIGNTYPTLADLLKRSDPDNSVAAIIELLAETNPILEDALTMEGNLPTGHRTTVRTGLPTGTWRKLYSGVPVEKSTTVQVDDTTGMLESYAQVDKSLADLNGNTSAFRLSESRAFLEGMNQTFASTFIYGDTDLDPEKFMGLAPRFDTLDSGDDTVHWHGPDLDVVRNLGRVGDAPHLPQGLEPGADARGQGPGDPRGLQRQPLRGLPRPLQVGRGSLGA
jgi:hypothetical protein